MSSLSTPFPWFGGKARAADIIWPRFGDVPNYSEPFAGSLAVLMRRPHSAGNEIVNDLNSYVANAWRAMQKAPSEVARHADWPVNEADLHARHLWLIRQTEFRERMMTDPDYFDAKIAGWWIWGNSLWIGGGFCQVPHLTGDKGVTRKVPHLTGDKGVTRKVPHLTGDKAEFAFWDAQSSAPDRRSRSDAQSESLAAWFAAIAERLRHTKVCCGDWSRVVTKAATYGQGTTAVLLDPPYDAGDSHDDVYGDLSRGVSSKVREWALANAENPLLRIALCGYDGEHAMPEGWECVAWKASGGYGNRREENVNAHRERIWFSPHCLKPDPDLFQFSASQLQNSEP